MSKHRITLLLGSIAMLAIPSPLEILWLYRNMSMGMGLFMAMFVILRLICLVILLVTLKITFI